MQKKSSKKPIIIVIVVIVIAALAYFYFSGNPVDNTSSLETSPITDSGTSEGFEILTLLNQINALRFENILFNTVVYKSLVDHTVVVREQNVGRPNPFAPAFGVPVPTPTPRPGAR